jgi:hypothetical protein
MAYQVVFHLNFFDILICNVTSSTDIDGYNANGLKGHFGKNDYLLNLY